MQINEALRMQIEVQQKLHEQLEASSKAQNNNNNPLLNQKKWIVNLEIAIITNRTIYVFQLFIFNSIPFFFLKKKKFILIKKQRTCRCKGICNSK